MEAINFFLNKACSAIVPEVHEELATLNNQIFCLDCSSYRFKKKLEYISNYTSVKKLREIEKMQRKHRPLN